MPSTLLQSILQPVRRAAQWVVRHTASASVDLSTFLAQLARADKRVDKPMEKVAAVNSGVRAIAQTIKGFPLVLHRVGRRDDVVESGIAFELLSRPNEYDTRSAFVEQWAGSLVEGGEAHIVIERVSSGRFVRSLTVAGRREMTPRTEPGTGKLLAWEYRRAGSTDGGKLLGLDETTFCRINGYYDPIRGLSPLEAAANDIRNDYHAAVYNASTLENGARPAGYWAFPEHLTADQQAEYLRIIRDRFSGAARAGGDWVCGGGVEYKQLAFNNVDMQLFEGRRFSRETIFNALGVPSVIVAIFESAHYDVADKSIEIFLTFTVQPIVQSFEDVLNLHILPRIEKGVACYLDTSKHPVMQRLTLAKLDSFARAIENGVPYNEAATLTGLPLKPQKWGDSSLLRSGLVTADEVIAGLQAPPETPPANEDAPDNQPAEPDAPEQERMRARQIAAAASIERRETERQTRARMPAIKRRFQAFFARQERDLKARLKRALRRRDLAAPRETAISENEIEAIVREVLLNAYTEQRALGDMAKQFFPEAVRATLRETLAAAGIEGEAADKIIERFAAGKLFARLMTVKRLRIQDIERVTRRRVQAELVRGLRAGETVQQLTDRIGQILGGSRQRSLKIARAEAGQAVSVGRFAAQQASNPRRKAWLTGANPRQTHVDAGDDYAPAKSIAFDKPFIVGGEALMFPRDPRGSAHEIVNCNCVMITVAGRADDEEARACV